jgi:DNA-binding NtrC family response regulator
VAKRGLIEVAEGGTLFVDEVAEMAPALQARLLRVLEDGTFRRVGSTDESKADVRVVAASNKDLEVEQKAGRFREDLYFRLNVVAIPLPLLRERRADIPELVNHFLSTRQVGPKRFTIEPAALAALERYDWPGNIRELANVLERAQILAEGETITVDDLPRALTATSAAADPAVSPYDLTAMERKLVREALVHTKDNRLAAARLLGISARTLYRMMERFGIS